MDKRHSKRRRMFAAQPHPAQVVVAGFGVALIVGTVLLMLPIATQDGRATSLITALFTTTGALSGALLVVDTGTHFTLFGELVVLGLIQVGGLGIMTMASLLALLVSRRLGLRMQLRAAAETSTLGLGDVKRVLAAVVVTSLAFEAVTAVILSVRFATAYDYSVGRAVYLGVFHGITSFNNAGWALFPDNMVSLATDPFVIVPMTLAMIAGGLGIPVILEVYKRTRGRHRWTMHTKITVLVYGALAVFGAVTMLVLEWANGKTIGAMGIGDKILAATFHSISARTSGFNSVDIGAMHPATLLITDILMFIGAGSASTAGGIKVTTFALLGFVILAEIRGEPTVHVMGRRLAAQVQRQAITIALMGVGVVMAGTVGLLMITDHDLDAVLFEVCSAFGTVGLTTGITSDLPVAGQLILIALMLIGRLGPITFASALALRTRPRRYELPEERPIVG